ncbi:FAD-dependent oxidoreductase [Methanobrevibacter sp. TMH8]|uniref:FAD-dependent oxidoreductase n=1 Tax=Methanobrevibacter sp. TMH8 TaxID=2848611 RepID=UPI001CC991DF|nr:FAD-dependent oxidoreductase [Methanobrevibacter sp. TMH8]MBZ9569958.1 FAD-dependent oxidoreductase [Methanobrevibacter sp. TMH8]
MIFIRKKHLSFWLDNEESLKFHPLKNETTVDVAIIGGGIVGITTGLMLKNKGFKVAIIESKRMASDVTGSTTAKLSICSSINYAQILSGSGEEIALKFKEASILAFDKISEIIKEYKIDCDYERMPLYIYSSNKKNFKDIKKEYDALKTLNIDVDLTNEFLTPFNEELPNEYNENNENSKSNESKENNIEYHNNGDNNPENYENIVNKAIKYNNQAQFHPKKYSDALIKHIKGDGSYIFERCKVLGIEEGEINRVKTENGDVLAKSVVIATNSPIYDPDSTLSYMTPVKSYMLGVYVKEELPDAMFVDINPFHTFRKTPTKKGDLLIIAGEHHITGHSKNTSDNFKKLIEFTKEKFELKDIGYFWSNQDNRPSDGLPIIGETSQKGIYVATGFGSWGMIKSTLTGMVLTDLISNKDNSYAEILSPKRLKNQKSIKKKCVSNFNTKDLNDEELKIVNDAISKLKIDEAKIVELPGRGVSIYKDSESNVFALHANCAHYGCRLSWNSAEKTWDCPQHGSMFDYKGNAIHGPTINNLKSYLK